MRFQRTAIAVFIALTSMWGGAAIAAPTIEPTATGFRATALTPGGEAVWFGASIGTFNRSQLLRRHARVVADADRDGVVAFDMPQPSRFVVLMVADLATGAVAIHRGAGVEGTELDLRGNQWRGALEHFDIPAQFLEVLLLRPGAGAWTMRGAEGGARDDDKSPNGAFRLRVKDMEPLAGTARPQGGVRPGDLLVIIDPQSLAYAVRTAKE